MARKRYHGRLTRWLKSRTVAAAPCQSSRAYDKALGLGFYGSTTTAACIRYEHITVATAEAPCRSPGPNVGSPATHRSIGEVVKVSSGSCVTSITGPNGGAELYER